MKLFVATILGTYTLAQDATTVPKACEKLKTTLDAAKGDDAIKKAKTAYDSCVAEEKAKTIVYGSSECLFCYHEDRQVGFLAAFSYCKQQDVCLKDAWNYINRPCQSEW